MQLRDDFAGIRFPGAWGLFGGHLDPGESPEEAIARELLEELEFAAANPAFIFRLCYPEDDGEQGEKHYYQIPVTTRQIAGFVQHEGAGMHLFAYDELMRQAKVIPHGLAAEIGRASCRERGWHDV